MRLMKISIYLKEMYIKKQTKLILLIVLIERKNFQTVIHINRMYFKSWRYHNISLCSYFFVKEIERNSRILITS